MPTFRAITISLISQYDIKPIPEFPILSSTLSSRSTTSVFVPLAPRAQLWIRYSIAQPIHPNQIFYFKMFVDGCHVTSWGVTQRESWRGKTMFDLKPVRFNHQDGSQEIYWEKTCFCFGKEELDASIEIKVYRAASRFEIALSEAANMVRPGYPKYSRGVYPRRSGAVDDDHPLTFYQYKLQDPLTKPLAVFCYQIRSWQRLKELGMIPADYVHDESQDINLFTDQESIDIGSMSSESSHDFVDRGDSWPLFEPTGTARVESAVLRGDSPGKDSTPAGPLSNQPVLDGRGEARSTSLPDSVKRVDEVKSRRGHRIDSGTTLGGSTTPPNPASNLARRGSRRFSWAGTFKFGRS